MTTPTETETSALEARLNQKLQQLREEIKEREPSVIGAIRTLTTDLLAWHRGKRSDFPRSAAIGLAFAYMRPRVILALGSISALIIAVAQIWLIKGQNEILAEQGRLTKAQVLGSILRELREQDPFATGINASVLAFGDVAFELVADIATSPSPEPPSRGAYVGTGLSIQNPDNRIWLNSLLIVSKHYSKLTRDQARALRLAILSRLTQTQAELAAPNPAEGWPLRYAFINGSMGTSEAQINDPAKGELTIAQAISLTHHIQTQEKIESLLQTLFVRLSTQLPPDSQDYTRVEEINEAVWAIAKYYNTNLPRLRDPDPRSQTKQLIDYMTRSLSDLCGATSGFPVQNILSKVASFNSGEMILADNISARITELCSRNDSLAGR